MSSHVHVCPAFSFTSILDCLLVFFVLGEETAHLAFLLFVNLVTLFSVHPFFLFGVLVGR